MKKFRITKHRSTPWLCVLASVAAFHAEGADRSNHWLDRSADSDEGIWMNHFRLGGFVGMNIKADFKLSGKFAVSGSNPGQPGGGSNHFYDDGYVRVDDTGNAGGYTSYWGYNNAQQFDGANTLTFHSANSYTTSGGAEVSAGPQIGVDLAYGGQLYRMGSALVGWEFGFGWLPINIKDDSQLTATVTRKVHQFNTAGIVLPTAPYNGGPSGIGPTIRDTATALPDDAPTGSVPVTGSRELDVTLYNFRLGPTMHWELHPKIAVAVSGGAAMGIIHGDLKFNETLNIAGGGSANSSGSFSDTQLTYGGYLAGKLMYHAVENGDYYIAVQYMPMSSVTFNGGGREAKLNLSGGLYISAGVNWPF